MTIASNTDLLAAVSNWLFGRTDLVLRIPEFVTLFEAKANRKLLCRQMETRVVATIDPGSTEPEYLTLPANFQTMRRVRLINSFSPTNGAAVEKNRLRFASGAQMDDLRDENPQPGVPVWFTIFGNDIEMCPTPNLAYEIEMVFRNTLPPLGSTFTPPGGGSPQTVTTNWLLAFAPDLYLYGALMEAAPYLRNDERAALWAGLRDTGFADLNKLSDESTFNAGPLTMRRTRRSY